MAKKQQVVLEVVGETTLLRKAYKEALNELLKLQNTAGATADEIARAAQKAADLKDRLGDANSTIDAFNPDKKFQAFGQALAGVAGGFAAAQGALALFGVESENVQKQLLKVQGALALSEGLNTVLDSVQGFKNLANVIKTNVINAFTTLKGAITATGIGLLAVAVAYLIGNWEVLTQRLITSFPVIAKIADGIGRITNSITDFIGITKEEDRVYEKQHQAYIQRKLDIEGQIEVLEAQGNKEREVYNLKKQLVNEEIKDLQFKSTTTAGLNKEEKETLIKKQNELKVLDAGFKKYLADKAKEAAEAKKKADDEAADKEQERLKQTGEAQFQEYQKLVDLKKQSDLDALQQEIDTFLRSNDIKEQDYQADLNRLNQVIDNYDAQKQIELDAIAGTEDAEKKKLEIIKKYADLTFGIEQKIVDTTKLNEEAKYNLKVKYAELGMQLGKFLQDVAGKNKDLAIAGIIIEQASAVALIGINTYKNASKAGFFTPLGIAEIAAGALAIGSAILTAKNGIDSINKVNIPGSSSSGGSAGMSMSNSAPVAPAFPPAQATLLDQQSLNQISNVVSRAYVVESDISGSQNRIKRIQNSARF
jgi:hypothetical protein